MKPVCSHHDHHWHEGEGAVEERQSVCLRRGSQRVLESFSRAAQMSCDVSCATSQSSSSSSSSSCSFISVCHLVERCFFAIPPFFWQIFTHFLLIRPKPDHCQCLPLSLTHSLTNSCLVDFLDVTLANEDEYSMLVNGLCTVGQCW